MPLASRQSTIYMLSSLNSSQSFLVNTPHGQNSSQYCCQNDPFNSVVTTPVNTPIYVPVNTSEKNLSLNIPVNPFQSTMQSCLSNSKLDLGLEVPPETVSNRAHDTPLSLFNNQLVVVANNLRFISNLTTKKCLVLIIITETNKCFISIKEKDLMILVYRFDLERAEKAKICYVDTF